MKQKPLIERIEEIQAECDAFIDHKAKQAYDQVGGNVPLAVLRGLITNKAPGCQCRVVVGEIEKEGA